MRHLSRLSHAAVAMLAAHGVPGGVTALPVAHSALFDAARELLREGGDRSAAVAQLRAQFPGATTEQIDRVLREAATILHASGERHDVEAV